jgi:ribosome-associated toxin RatA of RatAB toxin-antitoxin module
MIEKASVDMSELETTAQTELDAEDLDADSVEGVEITTERGEGRERQLSARVSIPHSMEQVWQILTDYDQLAEFIPSLSLSRQIEHPQGGIRIEQVGTQALMKLKFCARVVLDMVEHFPHQIDFQMVEGDFKTFRGSWILQPKDNGSTELCYTVSVLPPRAMPVGLIERKLRSSLLVNLTAIRQRADDLFARSTV